MAEDWRHGGFGLYVHWPFCQAKCPYCDFNSHVAANIDQSRWVRAYLSEIERVGAELPGRVLDTVFFGGGTPSLMAPETVAAILNAVRRTWPTSNSFEVTLEANPTSAEAGRFHGYRQAGVNRISMGLQALNDTDLRRLGRLHSAAEGIAAFEMARTVFDRVSFDLIYARQHQTLAAWETELKQSLALGGDHLSLYQLTIEDGTAFGRLHEAGKLTGLPAEGLGADMYDRTQEICESAGLMAYEVSNLARTGCESRHNLIYWRYGDYAGIGPGAHGRITRNGARFATTTPLAPEAWLRTVERNGSGEASREAITCEDQAMEYVMMGLRLREGISLDRVRALSEEVMNCNKINMLCEEGLLSLEGDTLRATDRGRLVLNSVLREILVA